MKIYEKLVLDPAGEPVEELSYEYDGPLAECSPSSPKPKFAPASYSTAGNILKSKEILGPLKGALRSDIIDNPFLNAASREMQTTTDAVRGAYGARGLGTSGIAIKGENEAISDIMLKSQQNRAQQLTGLMATGSSSPSFASQQERPGKGFMGLK